MDNMTLQVICDLLRRHWCLQCWNQCEDSHETSNTLHNRLQVNDLQAWVCEDDETPVAVYEGNEETVAEVLNHGKQNIYQKMTARMKKCVCLRILKLAKYWIASVK
jgi:hypothetical protein